MPRQGIFLVHSLVVAHWGYIIRQPGATAAQTAYPLPPPTTVVGAFAAPLARILGLPDSYGRVRGRPVLSRMMGCALEATLGARAGLLGGGVALVEEPSRIIGAPYKGGGALNRALKNPIVLSAGDLLPVQAVGAASGPGALLALVWLLDLDKLEKCLDMSISAADLRKASASIYRLGSREGIVSVINNSFGGIPPYIVLSEDGLEELGIGGVFESILYQPSDCVSPASSTSVARVLLIDEFYREREYFVPADIGSGQGIIYSPPGPVGFRLDYQRCRVYRPREGPRVLSVSVL